MLEEAKKQFDYFNRWIAVRSLHRSPVEKPSFVVHYRTVYSLKKSKVVDEIVPYVSEEDLEDILRSFKIDVRILLGEYIGKKYTGKTIV